jgi:hypothetical protein
MTLLINSPGQNLLSILKYLHRVLSLLDSELLLDVNPVKAHPFLGLESNRVNIHVSQSPYGTIRTLFRPDSILADTYQYP